MTTIFPQCLVCKHFKRDYTCAAFPAEIPESILLNEADHREQIEGDNGIQWEPLELGDVHPLVLLPE